MDNRVVALLIPLTALAIPVAAIVMSGLHKRVDFTERLLTRGRNPESSGEGSRPRP